MYSANAFTEPACKLDCLPSHRSTDALTELVLTNYHVTDALTKPELLLSIYIDSLTLVLSQYDNDAQPLADVLTEPAHHIYPLPSVNAPFDNRTFYSKVYLSAVDLNIRHRNILFTINNPFQTFYC